MDRGLQRRILENTPIAPIPEELFEQAEKMEELFLYNRCAIKEIQTKLEILNDELAMKTKRNPIESVSSRVKAPASIIEKMQRKGYPLTVESVWENLNDVAGVRVICSFVEDIYDVASMFMKQDDIEVIEVKDYIKNPKPNGYRSLHLIVGVPIFLSEKTVQMRVEVQIRTIAMDFWASLEHQVKYKKGVPDAERISDELKECAETITATDLKMQEIYHEIQEMSKKDVQA
ncbi:MAG: GTP pyrophosphokinase family protein [Lachnospiraceae bacterium]|nr:GTP pyrophosphokinase family protein [Lachnospiraceae bacterium]